MSLSKAKTRFNTVSVVVNTDTMMTCQTCFEKSTNTLICCAGGHWMCKTCIIGMVKGGATLRCPQCRSDMALSKPTRLTETVADDLLIRSRHASMARTCLP